MSEEWGEWQLHNGRGCPCKGMFAQWVWDDGTLRSGIAGVSRVSARTGRVLGPARDNVPNAWDWATRPQRRVIRYRIRKPRALQQLKDLAANPPAISNEDWIVPVTSKGVNILK